MLVTKARWCICSGGSKGFASKKGIRVHPCPHIVELMCSCDLHTVCAFTTQVFSQTHAWLNSGSRQDDLMTAVVWYHEVNWLDVSVPDKSQHNNLSAWTDIFSHFSSSMYEFLFNVTLACLQCIEYTDLIFAARHREGRAIKVFCGRRKHTIFQRSWNNIPDVEQDDKNEKWPQPDKEVGSETLPSWNVTSLGKCPSNASPPNCEIFSTCSRCYLLQMLTNEFWEALRYTDLQITFAQFCVSFVWIQIHCDLSG